MKTRIVVGLIFVLVAVQWIKPEANHGEYSSITTFEKKYEVSGEVQQILENKCYDCHSDNTNYPWYSQITPVSFWIDHHIEEGKEHLNFSKWETYALKRKDHKLEELIEEVEENKMPLSSYNILHGKLTDQEKKIIMDWAKGLRKQLEQPIVQGD